MAVLSRPHRGRAPFQAFGQDFLCAPHEGIYSPLFTIRELEQAGTLAYQPGVIATHYTEDPERVQVTVDALDEPGKQYVFTSERVILAAGALNSARLALASNQDTHTKLPLLDNPVSFVPAIDLTRIGAASAVRSYIGAELILVTPGEREERPLQGSVYGVEGPLRSDLIREFPLTMRGNFAASRFLVPALVMVQLFYPDEPNPHSWLKRAPNGALELARAGRLCSPQEGKVCRVLRRMGYLAAAPLAKRPGSGSSIHYAGTLPMMDSPHTRYHTDRYGKLSGTERIYVADAATFPSLPAKNHTLTLMANALRIARHVRSLATRP
jgi:choline dehydrogenase-like flavoprotein